MEKFKNRYRIPSARAAWWDYSSPGKYFITICTAFRECILGKITDKRMILSEAGKIVLQEWIKSFEIRSELSCDTFVIMPNHLHAILCIAEPSEVTDIKAPLGNHGVAYRSQNPFLPLSVDSSRLQPHESMSYERRPMLPYGKPAFTITSSAMKRNTADILVHPEQP